MTTYVLAGGGTAGHVNPLIATARALRDVEPEAGIVAVGTPGGLEEDLVPAAGFDLELITRAPFPRNLGRQAIVFPRDFSRAVRECRAVLRGSGADVVVGFGGYAATPMYLAARSMKIPVVVHEGNASPGLANRLGARFAHAVALTFASTKLRATKGETRTIGLPLRQSIVELAGADRTARRHTAALRFGLDADRPVIVVTGGSLGAQRLNETMAECAGDLDVQVLHIAGQGKDAAVRETVGERSDYRVVDYVADMDRAYALADLIITRAGAGMVCEVSALGIPAVFVPLPIGNGEQAMNATDVVAAGGAVLVDNSEFTPAWVRSHLPELMRRENREQMSAQARAASPLDAAQTLAGIIREAGRK